MSRKQEDLGTDRWTDWPEPDNELDGFAIKAAFALVLMAVVLIFTAAVVASAPGAEITVPVTWGCVV